RKRNELAMCHIWMRQYPQAIVEAKKALEIDPKFPLAYVQLGIARVEQGLPDVAIAELNAAIQSGHRHPGVQGALGYAYARAGKKPEAQKVLEGLTKLAEGRYGFALPIARIHAALGDKDQAIEWLQKACAERDPHVIWINVDPTFDNVRSAP